MKPAIIRHKISTHFFFCLFKICREFVIQKFRCLESQMNHIIFQKLEKMNRHCNTCAKSYALLTLLTLITFFIYFFNHFTLEILFTDPNALLPVIKMEALALGIMHIVYCFFFKYVDKKLQIFGLDSNNLNEYIQRNQAFFQKY